MYFCSFRCELCKKGWGCVSFLSSFKNRRPHLFLLKLLILGDTEVWLYFSWTCLFSHEVLALPQSSCFALSAKEKNKEGEGAGEAEEGEGALQSGGGSNGPESAATVGR